MLGLALLLGACTTADESTTTTVSVDPGVATTVDASPETSSPATPGGQVDYEPGFVDAKCEFAPVTDQQPRCGFLEVPENRSTEGSATVRLHVAIFESTSNDPKPDPVVYLEGGPGGDALETIQYSFEDNFAPFLAERDVIIFDQRGTGFSEPSFACPEVEDLTIEYIGTILETEESLDIELGAEEACHDRIAEDGVDFTAYNSAESAADVADLRRVLGYDEWNLYGISYGTKLALTVMRDHPEGVRSVVLDSVYPPERDLVTETPGNFARALDEFFRACEADPACGATYPDLEGSFFALVDELNAAPITVEVSDALTLERYDAAIDGDGFMGTTFQALYSLDAIRYLPRMITDLEQGETFVLGLLVSNAVTNRTFLSSGYYSVVQCREEAPFSDFDSAEAAIDAYPQFGDYFDASFGVGPATYRACEIWETGSADAVENEAVVSDIPTFVTTGLYDPITPPSWGAGAAEKLSSAFYRDFYAGHAATATEPCAQILMLAFLDDPATEPSDPCIAQMGPPSFLNPADAVGPAGYVEEPLEGMSSGTTARPEGWEEVNDGVWARGQTDLDTTVLLTLGVPSLGADVLLNVLSVQFGLETDTQSSYSSNGINWTIVDGDFNGAPVRAAAGDGDQGAIAVIFIYDPAEAPLWESVIFEILDRTDG